MYLFYVKLISHRYIVLDVKFNNSSNCGKQIITFFIFTLNTMPLQYTIKVLPYQLKI